MGELRPKSVNDEPVVSATTLWLVGMTVTKLRRPRERQNVIIEVSRLTARRSRRSMPLVLNESGRENSQQAKTHRNFRGDFHVPGIVVEISHALHARLRLKSSEYKLGCIPIYIR